ncbi:MAG: tetratricopeptide repeat protein [Bacteroidota bacterium]|nr:tetratricopeptide repeat protein [Bacteroidota bacterium]
MMKNLFLLVALMFTISATAQQAKKDTTRSIDPAGDLYKAALKQIDSAQYKEAIKTLQKAVKKNPELTAAYNKLAFCKMQTKDYKGAQKDLQHSLKLAPDNQECLKYLGRAYFYDAKYPEAKKHYDSALKIIQEDHELLVFIAELKIMGKDKKGAIASLDEALFHKPNYAPALFKRGVLKYEMGEYNYAIKDLNDGFKETKDTNYNSEIYQTRAKAYFEVGNYKASLKDYDKVVEREPKNIDALVNRAAAKININDNSGAIGDLDKALLMDKKNYVAYNFRGTAKTGLKQYDEAIKDFDMSIKLKFDYSSAYVNRAAAKMSKKDKKGCCTDLEKADQLGSPVAYKLIQQYCSGH